MQAVGRSVQDEMETFSDGANALQGAAQKRGKIHAQSWLRQSSALEGRFVVARQNPGFVRNARSIGSEGDVVSASLDHAGGLALFLVENVAENAALLFRKIFPSRAQFVEHAPWHKHGGGNLRCGMAEFLPGVGTVVFEEADVLDARVALEIEDAFGSEAQELADLIVAGLQSWRSCRGFSTRTS